MSEYEPKKDNPSETPEEAPTEGYTAAPGALQEGGEPTRPTAPQAAPQQPQRPPVPPQAGPYGQQPPPQRPNYGAPPPLQQQYPRQGYGAPPPGYGPPPPGYRPPMPPNQPPIYNAGGPPPRRNRVLPFVIGAAFFIIVIIIAAGGLLSSLTGGGSSTTSGGSLFSFGDKIAILDIEGVLGEGPGYGADTKVLVAQVNRWAENNSIKGMVLRINSPGGAVSATQDLFAAIENFKAKGKPVVASMGDIAASGGYYAAMGADEVYANDGTLTGSIGVIMSFYDIRGLQDKIGIGSRVIKSGEFKDIGSGSREMTEEEKALLDEMVVDVYTQFFEAVFTAREESVRTLIADRSGRPAQDVSDDEIRAHIEQYTDGRLFTGRQGFQYALIDRIGNLDDAIRRAAQLANIPEESATVRAPVRPRGLFGSIGTLNNKLEAIQNEAAMGFRIEYRHSPW